MTGCCRQEEKIVRAMEMAVVLPHKGAMSTQLEEQTADRTEPLVTMKHRETAMLVLQRGSEAGRRWPLDRTRPLTIGRSDDCDIVLPDRQVSRYHAQITWQGEHYHLED